MLGLKLPFRIPVLLVYPNTDVLKEQSVVTELARREVTIKYDVGDVGPVTIRSI